MSLRESDVSRAEYNRSNLLAGKRFSKMGNDYSLPDIHGKNYFEKRINSIEPFLQNNYRSIESCDNQSIGGSTQKLIESEIR